VLPCTAPVWLDRLVRWLEPFEDCFGHVAQRGAFRRYLLGLLSDSPRKSMSAMLARIHDAGSYQAFQHFITHAPWEVAPVWRRLLARVPDRRGVLIIDDTGFPKQGAASVGVQRQYSGTLGKIGNCQIAVTAALWTGARAWLLGAELYLPDGWLTRERRQQARIPARVRFQEKWRLALALVDRARRADIDVELVAADAGYGDILEFRTALEQRALAYMLGISGQFAVWIGRPPAALTPSTRAVTAASIGAIQVATWAAQQPARVWRRVTWRNGPHRAWQARFVAVRVTPVVLWRQHRPLQTYWLLCERPSRRSAAPLKWYISNLPATTQLRTLARAAHQRWAIEQQYQQLKTELGLDHFEGRSFPGWHRHVVLTALAYTWLQQERRRGRARAPTLPVVRGMIQEILTAHFFVTTPGYLERMLKLREIQLRI
jgi:SRSO17 transposase